MTFKDKAKWFSFEMSFVLAQSYAYACAYARVYVDPYVRLKAWFSLDASKSARI